MIHFWMIVSMLVNNPKLDDLYDPLLNDYASSNNTIFNNLQQLQCDRFHWRSHIGCSKGYSLDAYSQKRIKGINSQVNEQANSGLQKIRGQLAYMSVENFRIHCSLFLALKNMDKKFGLSLHALHL